ncbi:MAG: ribonuclease HII [Deinococcales bacterium]
MTTVARASLAGAGASGAPKGASTGASSAPAPSWALEAALWSRGYTPVAGVDEAGRGALAGPVVAAAVVLPPGEHPFRDSKVLTPRRREELARLVRERALAWCVAEASPAEIDRLNILEATRLAARRAVAGLGSRPTPAALVTDYLRLGAGIPELAVAKADGLSLQVAAASILAKTVRDDRMRALAITYPGYGFDGHKGYGSPAHLDALARLGPCPEHRRTFAPVAQGRLFAT